MKGVRCNFRFLKNINDLPEVLLRLVIPHHLKLNWPILGPLHTQRPRPMTIANEEFSLVERA